MSDDERLTDELACRVMGWKAGPDRFFKSGRSWIPRWRFRPFSELTDAFQLLDQAAQRYTLARVGCTFAVQVQTESGFGKATGERMARTITVAVVRALGLEVDHERSGDTGDGI